MFEHYAYAAVLLLSLGCLALLDWRWRLVFFNRPRAALLAYVIGMICFIAWDISGIGLHIFFSGRSRFMTNLYIMRDFPVEELCFLSILNYVPLLGYEWLERHRHAAR